MRCRLGLNQSRRDNFVFFDPDAPLHLSLSNPVGYTSRVTNSIVTALRVGKIIDIDNAIDIEGKCFKPVQAPLVNPEDAQMMATQTIPETPADVEQVPVNLPAEEEVVAPQEPAKAKGKKEKANEAAAK